MISTGDEPSYMCESVSLLLQADKLIRIFYKKSVRSFFGSQSGTGAQRLMFHETMRYE